MRSVSILQGLPNPEFCSDFRLNRARMRTATAGGAGVPQQVYAVCLMRLLPQGGSRAAKAAQAAWTWELKARPSARPLHPATPFLRLGAAHRMQEYVARSDRLLAHRGRFAGHHQPAPGSRRMTISSRARRCVIRPRLADCTQRGFQSHEKKPGPARARFQFAGVGPAILPEGNMLLHRRLWEDVPMHQRICSMRATFKSSNGAGRMSAMSIRSSTAGRLCIAA
jgi:hypothetical protein